MKPKGSRSFGGVGRSERPPKRRYNHLNAVARHPPVQRVCHICKSRYHKAMAQAVRLHLPIS